MTNMLGWPEIVLRLLLTTVAGFCIGLDRGEHGRPAGLRTTLLVALAACLAMIQANLLLPTIGKTPDSFVVLDLMRLPLGILSGMGFIGAGAILRRENIVVGVTTAATLWFITMIGLCFGGGQISLGIAGLVLGMIVLTGMRWIDQRLKQDRQGTFTLVAAAAGPGEEEIRSALGAEGYRITSCAITYGAGGESREWSGQIHWRGRSGESRTPDLVHALASRPGVMKVAWTPQER